MPEHSSIEAALRALGDEVSLCHFRINALLESIHGDAAVGATPSRRAVLRNLAEHGAMTVPRLAALRPVSRQYMQTIVNGLLRDGLVEPAPNPAHRSSPLMAITRDGRAALATMLVRERPLFAAAAADAGTARKVTSAVALLRRLRERMDALILAAHDGNPPAALTTTRHRRPRGKSASQRRRIGPR